MRGDISEGESVWQDTSKQRRRRLRPQPERPIAEFSGLFIPGGYRSRASLSPPPMRSMRGR